MTIGFIGLGIMGRPMAKNLLKANYSLIAYDINEDAVQDVVKCGAIPGKSIAHVAEFSSVIITMLPNSPQVKDVVFGKGGLLECAREGTTVIDMSSIAPEVSREVGYALVNKGISFLDAPVSGGEPKAIDGSLSIMVGGDQEILNSVKPILEALGSSIVHCGEIGAGNTVKLINQIIVASNIAALSEALSLGKAAGLDLNVVFNAIRGGLAGSAVMEAKAPMIIQGNYKPGFKINLHIKDLQNALDTGHIKGVSLPLTALIMEMFQQVRSHNGGDLDHSALIKYYESINK